MDDRYAVFGNPIEHSLSPQIHTAFAEQTGQHMQYTRQLVEPNGFSEAAGDFFDQGGKGLNITVPFKLDAYAYASRLTRRARQAGAVNTLAKQPDGEVLGDNTDGAGLVHDLINNLQWEIAGKNLLVVGAGGAVRGVLAPLLDCKPVSLVIANRTAEKARGLATAFGDLGPVSASGFDALAGRTFDIIINGASTSLSGDLPPLPPGLLAPGACCYDMVYGSRPTVFIDWATRQGAEQVADGLGMLVEQAAESFALWRGVKPQTLPVINLLRSLV
jgi:shikimate dehydrogenase